MTSVQQAQDRLYQAMSQLMAEKDKLNQERVLIF